MGVEEVGRKPRAAVYIDGFNLYRRALEHRPDCRWLDVRKLSETLLPDFEVVLVRYFTARVRFVEGEDPAAPSRQSAYLRALATLPAVTTHFGTFRSDRRWMAKSPLELDDDGSPRTVRVRKIEEKGSDVSLAAHLVCDAMDGLVDAAFVLSNDSDFVDALRIVRERGGVEIGLMCPSPSPVRSLLALEPDHVRHVRAAVMRDSQLPDRIADVRGVITRPKSWRARSTEAPPEAGLRAR
ncbi:NYN domain-containing protein [Curtobacterium sp. 18060]|uniref:NYN domain-containing protein n=1 Tax=Curtobacterium sp. 18060 TaxID=2681408 RepID=UPI00135B5915|nr:NYN domain-containing protein [Curtobacterium sp. 18060]